MTRGRALAVLLWAVTAHPAAATMPPLPLPAWVKVDLALERAPELNGTAPVKLTLTALLDRLEGARYEVDVPSEIDVVSGQKKGAVDLERGKPVVVELGLRPHAPVEGANVAVEVTTRPPRSALAEEVGRTWKDEREIGMKLIAALPKEDVQRRIVGLTVTPEEAFLAESRDPAYRRVVKTDKSVFLLLDALPNLDAKAVERQLREYVPRLERFRKISSGKEGDPITRLTTDLTLQVAKLRCEEVVLALAAGQAANARAALSAPEVAKAGMPPALEHGRRMAMIVASAMLGDLETASRELDALGAVVPPGPARRYVEYNRAEVHRLAGRIPEAKEAYGRALAVAPSLSLARRRLAELK